MFFTMYPLLTSMKNVVPYHAFQDRIRSDEQLAPQRKTKKQSTFQEATRFFVEAFFV